MPVPATNVHDCGRAVPKMPGIGIAPAVALTVVFRVELSAQLMAAAPT